MIMHLLVKSINQHVKLICVAIFQNVGYMILTMFIIAIIANIVNSNIT